MRKESNPLFGNKIKWGSTQNSMSSVNVYAFTMNKILFSCFSSIFRLLSLPLFFLPKHPPTLSFSSPFFFFFLSYFQTRRQYRCDYVFVWLQVLLRELLFAGQTSPSALVAQAWRRSAPRVVWWVRQRQLPLVRRVEQRPPVGLRTVHTYLRQQTNNHNKCVISIAHTRTHARKEDALSAGDNNETKTAYRGTEGWTIPTTNERQRKRKGIV